MRVGVAHHLGWAVVITADDEHRVVDRRRIELVDPGLPAAPVHHHGGVHAMHEIDEHLDDDALGALVEAVRGSATTLAAAGLADLASAVQSGAASPIESLSVAVWPPDFPTDIAVVRRVPYESRVDSVMYRQVLADAARAWGWAVHPFEPKAVEADAARLLGDRAHDVLHGPRTSLGPPWTKDHRLALAATILASGEPAAHPS